MDVVFYILALVVGWFVGTMGWCQIVGASIASKIVDDEMPRSKNNDLNVWKILKNKRAICFKAAILWSVILIVVVVLSIVIVKDFAWGVIVGLVLSFLATLKARGQLREEFLEGYDIERGSF